MITIYDLKPKFQALLRPLTQFLAKAGFTANQVTIFAAVISILTGATIAIWPEARWPLFCVPVVMFVRMALNAIDGMLAREHNQKSDLGSLLNELCDVISDAMLYLPFGLLVGISMTWVSTVVMLSIITEVAGLAAIQIGASRRYDGPMGKSDRAFVFGCIAFMLAIGLEVQPWLNYIWMAVVVLLMMTIANRMKQALQETVNESI
jgi:CDP-diacylglycerol---glycerol-3-phosphate 3-phosphatidyltransferase